MRDRLYRFLADGPLLTTAVVLATLGFHALYLVPLTRRPAQWILGEDLVIENITFISILTASVLALLLGRRIGRAGSPADSRAGSSREQPRLVRWYWLALGAGLFVVAMEEISWGQWVFFFETPDSWKEINRQGETNLHNLAGLWGQSEWLRLGFVLAGLSGLLANRWRSLRMIAVPRPMLGWFVFMAVYVGFDAINDFVDGPWILSTFNPMSEWVEMLIGLSALVYALLKRAEFTNGSTPSLPAASSAAVGSGAAPGAYDSM